MDAERIRIVSAFIPHLNNLRCLVGRIDENETRDSSVQSFYHWRILKCRLLIHSIPDIIASPVTMKNNQGDIYILIKTELFLTGKIQNELNNMNIKYSEPILKVTRHIYEACLNYTILFKLAPQWNKVDKYFLQGKYFLAFLAESKNAVKMNITINDTDEELQLEVSSDSVKVPTLSLRYFSIPGNIVENFLSNNDGFIDFYASERRPWIHVLPSLKKGKVISISRKIPQTCSFRDYEQLKRHWKNMYGYRLPETDIGLIYYQIYFPGLGTSFYTYPSCCVSSDELEQLGENAEDTGNCAQFLKDLTERLPTIFGVSLKLEEKGARRACNNCRQEVNKENISFVGTWPEKVRQAEKIFNRKATSNLKLTGNYFQPKTDGYCKALSTLSDNSGGLRLRHNIIKDRNLRDALNMKPFLDFQTANRIGSATCIHKFLPVIGNDRSIESPSISVVASSSYAEENKLQKLASPEFSRVRLETIRSSECTETDTDKSLAADRSNEEYDELLFPLLRSRSSFDLNDFHSKLSETVSPDRTNLLPNVEKKGVENDVEIKSHYFDNLENESQNNGNVNSDSPSLWQRVKQSEKTESSTKIKLHRLSSRKLAIPKVSMLNFQGKNPFAVNIKTKDISAYFREKKKQVGVFDLPETEKQTFPPKLIQTQLNMKRSGKLELCVENKKKRLMDEN